MERQCNCPLDQYIQEISTLSMSLFGAKLRSSKRKAEVLTPSSAQIPDSQKPKRPKKSSKEIIIDSSIKKLDPSPRSRTPTRPMMCSCGCGLISADLILCGNCNQLGYITQSCFNENSTCCFCKPPKIASFVDDSMYLIQNPVDLRSKRFACGDINEISLVQELFASDLGHVDMFKSKILEDRTKPSVIKSFLTFKSFRALKEYPGYGVSNDYYVGDVVIDIYMDMLQQRSIAYARRRRWPLSIYFSCFVAGETSSLTPEVFKKKELWKELKMRSGLSPDDWAMVDKIYFPAYHDPLHWVLYVFTLHSSSVVVYDSLKAHNSSRFEICKAYVDVMIEDQLGRKDWTISFNDDQPLQHNGVDCGVFTIMTADFLSDDLKLDFRQEDIKTFRTKIACDIVRGYLAYDF